MKIVAVNKGPKKEEYIVDLDQACSIWFVQEGAEQGLEISCNGGRTYAFDVGSYDLFLVVREPFQGSITVRREPTTPRQIMACYEGDG